MEHLLNRPDFARAIQDILPPEEGLPDGCSTTEVLKLYRHSADPAFAGGLFGTAGQLRDRHLGRKPWWSAGVSAITPCELDELCSYCTFFTRNAATTENVVAAVRALAGLGIRHLHLSGDTRIPVDGESTGGRDQRMVDLVVAIRDVVDVEIEINVGPSLTRSGVRTLKELGVAAITSSLGVLIAQLFKRFKPGDSLTGRIRLMELCEEEGMPNRSMLLVGLGETDEDRIDHLLFLRRFSVLRHLRLSRYMPFPGAASTGLRCSPWPVARLTAIARLLYPTLDLGLAQATAPDDMALWRLAGGGNQVLGTAASMKDPRGKCGESRAIPVCERIVVHDNMSQITRYLSELGLTPSFLPVNSTRRSLNAYPDRDRHRCLVCHRPGICR